MRIFRVGEKKDCPVTVSNILDSTDFSILNATYSHHAGLTVYNTGACSVSGKTVYFPLQPTVVVSNSVVTFTITCQPLDELGEPDTTKTIEIIMHDVPIKVTK